jgi:tetratricopeptide (TPR) repeat protein
MFPPLPQEAVRSTSVVYGGLIRQLRKFGDTPALGRGCAFLATLHAAAGDLKESEQLFDEARTILERSNGSDKDLAWVFYNHGLVQIRRGQYVNALRSFWRGKRSRLSSPA